MNIEPATSAGAVAPIASDLPTPEASASTANATTPLQVPVSVRSVSLAIIALLAGLFVLQWARAVFIPFMLGLVLSYALSPLVNWMEARRIPRAVGAGLLLLGLMGAMGTTAYALSDEAAQLVESLPAAAQKFRQTIKTREGTSRSPLDTVQRAAAQIEQVAQGTSATTSGGAMRVIVEPARFNIKDYLWTGTIGLATLVGQTTAVVFLTYFLMVSGNTFRRKLIKLAGPSLSSKKVTLQALDEITGQIQRYLQVQLATSALVGVLTGLALWALGLENAAVWGIVAGVLNMVPYVGSLITAVASGAVAFLQFGSSNMALLVAGASVVIHTIVGNIITPWLTSRASRMNPVAVFVGLLAWGWLWGVWGLLLGLPILMIVKAVCDRVDDLKPVGEFLGA
jgi:predicted PurR-regulated permease PerM